MNHIGQRKRIIQKYMKKKKAKDWQIKDILKKLPMTKPYEVGRCMTCGKDYFGKYEGLTPIDITICKNCATRFSEMRGSIPLKGRNITMKGYYCDWCFGKCFVIHKVMLEVCDWCLNKQGRLYKFRKYKKLRRRK